MCKWLLVFLSFFHISHACAQTGSSKTIPQLTTEINSSFPDQSVGGITPAILRQVTLDMINSGINGSSVTSGFQLTKNWTISGPFGPTSPNLYANSITAGITNASTNVSPIFGNLYAQNFMNCSDTVIAAPISGNPNGVNCLLVNMTPSASSVGTRTALEVQENISSPMALTSGNDYMPVLQTNIMASANVGGTGGTPVGSVYGFGSQALGVSGATNYAIITGGEFDVGCTTGCSAANVYGINVARFDTTTTHGSLNDAGIAIYKYNGGVGWNAGIQFGQGASTFPVVSTGTMIGTNDAAAAAAHGIDFSQVTFSSDAFKSNGFFVNGSGDVVSGGSNGFLLTGSGGLVTKDASTPLTVNAGGGNGTIFSIHPVANAGAIVNVTATTSVNTPSIGTEGTSSVVALSIIPKGGGQVNINTGGVSQFVFSTQSSNNMLCFNSATTAALCTGMFFGASGDPNFYFNAQSGAAIYFKNNNSSIIGAGSNAIFPVNDNQASLGFTGNRWTNVFLALSNAATTSAVCISQTTSGLSYDGAIGTCNTSTMRVKHDIRPLSETVPHPLEAVLRMRPDSFFYNADQHVPGQQLGLIAEDLAAIDPRLVGYDDGGLPNSIRFLGPLHAYEIGAIQELNARVDALERRIK